MEMQHVYSISTYLVNNLDHGVEADQTADFDWKNSGLCKEHLLEQACEQVCLIPIPHAKAIYLYFGEKGVLDGGIIQWLCQLWNNT